jgi:hypothetical protein
VLVLHYLIRTSNDRLVALTTHNVACVLQCVCEVCCAMIHDELTHSQSNCYGWVNNKCVEFMHVFKFPIWWFPLVMFNGRRSLHTKVGGQIPRRRLHTKVGGRSPRRSLHTKVGGCLKGGTRFRADNDAFVL